MLFTTAQKVTKHLGYFCYKICCQEMPKIALSGHTGSDVNSGFFCSFRSRVLRVRAAGADGGEGTAQVS